MIRVSKFQRQNSHWYVRYWMGGRPVDESARTTSEAGAETYRIRREMEINAGIQPIKHVDLSDLTSSYIESLVDRWAAR